MMNYAALVDGNDDVQQVIVIPPGETEAYCAALGLPGTYRHAPILCAIGQHHDQGTFYTYWFQIPGADAGPDGAESGFPESYEMWHNGAAWVSTVGFNVWEPGVANWHRKDGTWVAPTGSTDAYALDAEVFHAGEWWISDQDANVSEPGVAGWRLRDAPQVAVWTAGTVYTQPATVTGAAGTEGEGRTWTLQTASETASVGREPWQAYMWAVWAEVV